jgi:acetyl esterase/lipase
LIHGTHDTLAPTEESRRFAHALRAVSDQPVVLAEIDGAQHAFDIFHSVRGRYAVDAIAHFLTLMRDRAERAHDVGGAP